MLVLAPWTHINFFEWRGEWLLKRGGRDWGGGRWGGGAGGGEVFGLPS